MVKTEKTQEVEFFRAVVETPEWRAEVVSINLDNKPVVQVRDAAKIQGFVERRKLVRTAMENRVKFTLVQDFS